MRILDMRRFPACCVSLAFTVAFGGATAIFGFTARAEDTGITSQAFKDKLEICGACHDPTGVAKMEGVPNLAAAPDLFVEWQLVYFRGETRKNDMMTPAAKDLTDQDIRNFGAYFLTLAAPDPSEPDSDRALTAAGAKIAEDRHCAQCHLDNLAGQGETPRLAGQREDYIVKALHDYQQGARRGRGNVIMPEIAYSLNEDDIKALAHFMSRQRPK
jgi:cytochrome c553